MKERLLELMRENPDLPIVPIMEHDMEKAGCFAPVMELKFTDTSEHYIGALGKCEIGEYMIRDGAGYFRKDEDPLEVERIVSHEVGCDKYDQMTDQEAMEVYRNMPWTRAIIVYIVYPAAGEEE